MPKLSITIIIALFIRRFPAYSLIFIIVLKIVSDINLFNVDNTHLLLEAVSIHNISFGNPKFVYEITK